MQKYECAVPVPSHCYSRRSKIEVALREEWPDGEIVFEETEPEDLWVKIILSDFVRMTDVESGEEMAGKGMTTRAQEIVVEVCRDDLSGF
jgi:hypothetical protein